MPCRQILLLVLVQCIIGSENRVHIMRFAKELHATRRGKEMQDYLSLPTNACIIVLPTTLKLRIGIRKKMKSNKNLHGREGRNIII